MYPISPVAGENVNSEKKALYGEQKTSKKEYLTAIFRLKKIKK